VHGSDVRPGGRRCKHTAARRAPAQPGYVTSTSFTPGAGYLATTLLDRTSGERTWGNALRGATGLQLQLGPVAIYGDVYREIAAFRDGAAPGSATIDGVTVGRALQP